VHIFFLIKLYIWCLKDKPMWSQKEYADVELLQSPSRHKSWAF